MIDRLNGTCILKVPGRAVVDVAGVGYGVEMSDLALATLGEGRPATVWIHTHVSADAIRLFGFPTHIERQVFELLIGLDKVGPKLALALMNALPPRRLFAVIRDDDAAALQDVPGIGERLSKKILFDLKPKLAKSALALHAAAAGGGAGATAIDLATAAADSRPALPPAILADLRSALENFGYRDKELAVLLRRFERQPPARDLPNLVRLALAELQSGALARDTADSLF